MKQLGKNSSHVATGTARRRFFPPAEANRALVLVKRVVADVVRGYSHLLDSHEIIEAARISGTKSRFDLARQELVQTADKLRDCMEELTAVGVELKDWAQGIVDFPSVISGREVRLCWRHGERAVEHWHEVDESFAQRRPIQKLESSQLLAPIQR